MGHDFQMGVDVGLDLEEVSALIVYIYEGGTSTQVVPSQCNDGIFLTSGQHYDFTLMENEAGNKDYDIRAILHPGETCDQLVSNTEDDEEWFIGYQINWRKITISSINDLFLNNFEKA